jgi:hypothetical protein
MKGDGGTGMGGFNHEAGIRRRRFTPHAGLALAGESHHFTDIATVSFGILPHGPLWGASSR